MLLLSRSKILQQSAMVSTNPICRSELDKGTYFACETWNIRNTMTLDERMDLEGIIFEHNSKCIHKSLKDFTVNSQIAQDPIVILANGKSCSSLCNGHPVTSAMWSSEKDDGESRRENRLQFSLVLCVLGLLQDLQNISHQEKEVLRESETNIFDQYPPQTMCQKYNRSMRLKWVSKYNAKYWEKTHILNALIREIHQHICCMLVYVGSIYRIQEAGRIRIVSVRQYPSVFHGLGQQFLRPEYRGLVVRFSNRWPFCFKRLKSSAQAADAEL